MCIVFYNGQTILGAPYAGYLCKSNADTIKANFIDKSPENGYTCQSYPVTEGKKLVAFEYEELKEHPNYGMNILPHFKPIFWSSIE